MFNRILVLQAVADLGNVATIHDIAYWLDKHGYWDGDSDSGKLNRIAYALKRNHKLEQLKDKVFPAYKPPYEVKDRKRLIAYSLQRPKSNAEARCAVLTTTPRYSDSFDLIENIPKTVVLCVYLFDDVLAEKAAWNYGGPSRGVPRLTMSLFNSLYKKFGRPWFSSINLENTYYQLLRNRRKNNVH